VPSSDHVSAMPQYQNMEELNARDRGNMWLTVLSHLSVSIKVFWWRNWHQCVWI